MSEGWRVPEHYRDGGLVPRMRRFGFGGWADYRAMRRHRRRMARRDAGLRMRRASLLPVRRVEA